MKILLIDDSVSDRRIYKRYIENNKWEEPVTILEASSGKSGVAVCEIHSKNQLSCIILDFHLPDTDGISLIADIRKHSDAPIILITGQPAPLTQTQAYRQGVVKYLAKDFLSSESLVSAILDVAAAV